MLTYEIGLYRRTPMKRANLIVASNTALLKFYRQYLDALARITADSYERAKAERLVVDAQTELRRRGIRSEITDHPDES